MMAEFTELSEDIILDVIRWLPVKSLIRFTSVSKRWRSIILSDPQFAASQFNAARRRKTNRLLLSTDAPQLATLDLDDTPSFNVSKRSFPFEQPGIGCRVTLLGCCNGMVFVAVDLVQFYVWNPATGFFKQLPKPEFVDGLVLREHGVGYLSATDDYRVLAYSVWIDGDENDEAEIHVDEEMKMFSSKAHVWKTVQYPAHFVAYTHRGILLNEALHWSLLDDIVVFDFASEEFRTMVLVPGRHDGVELGSVGVSEGCLCVCGYVITSVGCSVDFWVMREYGVAESWTKLFNFAYAPTHHPTPYSDFLVMENCTVAVEPTGDDICLLKKIDHKQESETGMYMIQACPSLSMIPYEQSLLRIDD
ncbi:F-box protein CPR1-like [Argentina anserina]|uniref:F-box protein CPR1-like n=1 Tax=Argentina anserina TaxID=57926 RepID=UPI0021766947|nr:F-box protein CPR1-like [Potentilla anserina]